MQIDKLIVFHKTVGDATRIRILSLLASGPQNGQTLAGILKLSPPTISHHLTKLKEINLVIDRRDKNTIYYHLKPDVLKHYVEALPSIILERGEKTMTEEQKKIVKNFFTKEGRLKIIPAQRKKKMLVLYHLAEGLEMGKKYQEKEINEYIQHYHEDYATIRREWIMASIMYRDKGIYELNPRELWAKIVE